MYFFLNQIKIINKIKEQHPDNSPLPLLSFAQTLNDSHKLIPKSITVVINQKILVHDDQLINPIYRQKYF